MIKFGPSGFCDAFLENHSHSEEVPEWLVDHGLNAYEYAFNKGVRISDEKAIKIREAFEKHNTAIVPARAREEMLINKTINKFILLLGIPINIAA